VGRLGAGRSSKFTVRVSGSPVPGITESGSLPPGVTLVDDDNGTATVSGTPTTPGTCTVVLTGANAVGSTTQKFTLTVKA